MMIKYFKKTFEIELKIFKILRKFTSGLVFLSKIRIFGLKLRIAIKFEVELKITS